MYSRMIPMRQGLVDMFENNGRFMDRSSSGEYSCHQVRFRINGCIVNGVSERSKFHQVLMHPRERLMIRLPPRWLSFPKQLNSNSPFLLTKPYVAEVDIH
ncbi:hypothetical protein TNCV_1947331 [Trichonephila clavipes]|nr:hypothetical protein TNCV_1947331 [Trichonephila clavipes]